MDLKDLYKLAGITPSNTPAIEPQAVPQTQEETFDGRGDMRAMIALISPEQLNQLTGEQPVDEELADLADATKAETKPNPQEYRGTLGSPSDNSLRRYLDAAGDHVTVDEDSTVYVDHKLSDINEAWNSYKTEDSSEDRARANADGNKSKSDVTLPVAPWDADKSDMNSDTMEVNKAVSLAGDSLWSDSNPSTVNVTEISVTEESDGYAMVNVMHDGPWEIYTDSGFEKEISEIVGFEVSFTEQGMQEKGIASLEGTKGQLEGNEFTGALAGAKKAGEDEFEVDGKTYKVKEDDSADDELSILKRNAGI